METNQTMHKFEAAGLGRAPFKFIRFYVSKYQACQGAPVQCGSSCDYCATPIMNVYVIASSDGKEFKVGCDCVYKTFQKTAAVTREVRQAQRLHLREIHAAKRAEQAETSRVSRHFRFLNDNPGLAAALETDHQISRDLAAKLGQWGSLSVAQVALAFRLAAQAYGPQRAPEVNIPAPEGKNFVRGKVVSIKNHESQFGTTAKMTVKVDTGAGVWLCWGTCPSNLLVNEQGFGRSFDEVKGKEVEFSASLVRGRDAHFAIFKRPTKAQFVTN